MIIRYIYISFQLYCSIVYAAPTDGRGLQPVVVPVAGNPPWQLGVCRLPAWYWRVLLLPVRDYQTHNSLMLLFTREV